MKTIEEREKEIAEQQNKIACMIRDYIQNLEGRIDELYRKKLYYTDMLNSLSLQTEVPISNPDPIEINSDTEQVGSKENYEDILVDPDEIDLPVVKKKRVKKNYETAKEAPLGDKRYRVNQEQIIKLGSGGSADPYFLKGRFYGLGKGLIYRWDRVNENGDYEFIDAVGYIHTYTEKVIKEKIEQGKIRMMKGIYNRL